MLKKCIAVAIVFAAVILSPAFSTETRTLSFSTKDGVLTLYSGGKSLGQFPNVIVNNGGMASDVEDSATGSPIIRIITDGSRNKYDVTIPIIEDGGVVYTNCAYKSFFDSNDGNRSVGVSCSLAPLREFDPEAAINEENLIRYQVGFDWLKNAASKNCSRPQGIEYGIYHIALCAKQAYPDPSQETTIVFDVRGNRIFSVLGYEFIPGGMLKGEFALVGAVGEHTVFHVNNLDCLASSKIPENSPSRSGEIGKYKIKYFALKEGGGIYGRYSYDGKENSVDLLGISLRDATHLLEVGNGKKVTGLFDLMPDIYGFEGNWISAPPGKILPVR
ncbi:hypothetical protein [Paraburkholderia bannensis]|uniref:hypothetical protein n=1 Tax=Paraburkholderia bannensis TaxID=765414 RepID=UPI002AB7C28F|nr:hypothetical protein [Paraburkholderia bannensis]